MSQQMHIDLRQVREFAAGLSEAAADLQRQRPDLLTRLAVGDLNRPVEKAKENVKVAIGVPAIAHPGSQAGETVAARIKSCGDAFEAVEDGLRALGSVMAKLSAALEGDDVINQEEINAAVADLYCVALVAPGQSPDPVDWFGLGEQEQ